MLEKFVIPERRKLTGKRTTQGKIEKPKTLGSSQAFIVKDRQGSTYVAKSLKSVINYEENIHNDGSQYLNSSGGLNRGAFLSVDDQRLSVVKTLAANAIQECFLGKDNVAVVRVASSKNFEGIESIEENTPFLLSKIIPDAHDLNECTDTHTTEGRTEEEGVRLRKTFTTFKHIDSNKKEVLCPINKNGKVLLNGREYEIRGLVSIALLAALLGDRDVHPGNIMLQRRRDYIQAIRIDPKNGLGGLVSSFFDEVSVKTPLKGVPNGKSPVLAALYNAETYREAMVSDLQDGVVFPISEDYINAEYVKQEFYKTAYKIIHAPEKDLIKLMKPYINDQYTSNGKKTIDLLENILIQRQKNMATQLRQIPEYIRYEQVIDAKKEPLSISKKRKVPTRDIGSGGLNKKQCVPSSGRTI